MRLPVLSLFCLLYGLNSFGQIIDPRNSWNYLEVKLFPNTSYQNYNYFIGADTIINDKTYAILYESTRRPSDTNVYSHISGFLRDEDNHKKVYFLPRWKGASEKLLYDFTIKIDSIFMTEDFREFRVINIDSIQVKGVKKLRIQFALLYNIWIGDPPPLVFHHEWIEDIGSPQGFLKYSYTSIDRIQFSLLCFKLNNELMLENDFHYDCSYAGPLNSIYTEKTEELSIYPNPASDLLTVQSKKIIYNLSIYSVTGEKVYQVFPQNAFYQVNLTNLKSGLYFVSIDNIFKKIIIE